MKIKILFISLAVILSSTTTYAQQCEQKKKEATDKCSPEQLREAKKTLEANAAAIGALKMDDEKSGAVEVLESNKAANGVAQKQVDGVAQKCQQAIETCRTTCDSEKSTHEQNIATQQQATTDGNNSRYCTEEKPAEDLKEAKKTSADLGKIMETLAGIISSLMNGQQAKTPEGDECTPSATRSAAVIMMNPACSTDTASTGTATSFANGDYRSASGKLVGEGGLEAGEAQMGVGAKQELSKGSVGGGGGAAGGGSSPMGSMNNNGSKNAAAGKDDKPVVSANNYGGGGGGSKGGGGGPSKPGGPVTITKSSLEDDRLMNTAVDKALQARGMASEGLPGGITGAHSTDNFLKVERRIQNERNQLNEL